MGDCAEGDIAVPEAAGLVQDFAGIKVEIRLGVGADLAWAGKYCGDIGRKRRNQEDRVVATKVAQGSNDPAGHHRRRWEASTSRVS